MKFGNRTMEIKNRMQYNNGNYEINAIEQLALEFPRTIENENGTQ